MSREANLAKNTFIITIGKVCTQLVSFLLLPLYTALLTAEDYGIVDLLNTLVSLLLPIVTLQVDQALFRELIEARKNEEQKAKIISTGTITVVLQCFIYLVLFACISPLVHNEYKFFLASNVLMNAFVMMLLQISRGLGDNKRYAVASFLSASLTIVFNVLFLVAAGLGARGMLLATFTAQFLASVYLFISLKLYRYIRISEYRKTIIRKLWQYSIPLIPNAISWWIIDASDRVIATGFLGVDQNGILAASLKFALLLTGLNYITTLSWTESIATSIDDEDIQDYFNRMMNVILGIFISLSIGMIACVPFAFPMLINAQYSSGYGLVPISVMATLFNVVVGLISVVYVAKKNTKAIARTSFFAAVINIATHLALIKFIGLYAAVTSSFIAFFTMSVYRYIDIRKQYFKIKVDRRLVLKALVTLAIVIPCYYINNTYLNIASLAVAVFFAWNVNHKSIGAIMKVLRKKILRR